MTEQELDQRLTPECLQQRFGLPAELGTVAVPRIFQSFKGVARGDQRDFLGVILPAIMSGAIAFEGQHGYTVKGVRQGVTQATMAEHAGVRRETITARMSRLTSPAKARTARSRWLQARNTRDTMLAKFELHKLGCEQCAAAGSEAIPDSGLCKTGAVLERGATRKVKYEEEYAPTSGRATAAIVLRTRRFMMASRYGVAMPMRREMFAVFDSTTGYECSCYFSKERADEDSARMTAASMERGSPTVYEVGTVEVDGGNISYPSIEQLTASSIADWFNHKFRSQGFKNLSRYIWDPRLLDPDTGKPLGTTPRIVMSYYESAGLMDEMPNSKRGELTVLQETVRDRTGLDESTIYRANCKLEALGLIRIVSGSPKPTESGVRRGPMMVLYFPFRQLTEAEAVIEEQRMAEACRRILAREGAQRFRQVLDAKHIHHDLLAEWRGREHCMGAFWRELDRRLDAALIFPDLIAQMVPPIRSRATAEAMEPDWFDTPPPDLVQ